MMSRTAIHPSDIEKDENLALPYARLNNGKFLPIPLDWSAGGHVPVMAAMGIRSSVNDMLKFAAAVLEAERIEEAEFGSEELVKNKNPLREIVTTRLPAWIRPIPDNCTTESAYCLGWCRMKTPSSMLGWTSLNAMTRYDNEHTNQEYILGISSKPILVVQHCGVMNGSTATFYTFPETGSAIIVFANNLNHGDAADFTAHILFQALFDLQPHVDLLPLARAECKKREQWYPDILADWTEHRDTTTPEKPLSEYTGVYEGLATRLDISINPDTNRLAVVFNHHAESLCHLEYYNKDAYSFLPKEETMWKDGMVDWDYYKTGIFKFQRTGRAEITGLLWQWDEQDAPTLFTRVTMTKQPCKEQELAQSMI